MTVTDITLGRMPHLICTAWAVDHVILGITTVSKKKKRKTQNHNKNKKNTKLYMHTYYINQMYAFKPNSCNNRC